MEANQTLHDVWPSPGLVHYVCIFRGPCPVKEFCQVQHSLCVQVLRSPILAALLHGTSSGRQPNCGVEQRALPIFGRAAITLALAHILVSYSCAAVDKILTDRASIARRAIPLR